MGELVCRTRLDLDVATARLDGELTLASAPKVRERLLKCLADCPTGVVVDVSGVTVDSDLPLIVFAAVARRAAQWPGVPLLLYGPTGDLADRLARRAVGRHLPVYATRTAALAALGSTPHPIRTVRADLAAGLHAAAQARRVVADACHGWQLTDLVGDAELIVTEMASNAVRHGVPPVRLLVALRGPYLHIVVRDGSPSPPEPYDATGSLAALRDHGHGLYLVEAVSTAWGSLASADGKAVWATLRAEPIGPSPEADVRPFSRGHGREPRRGAESDRIPEVPGHAGT
jgi:anti-anti-sigma regulatory factor/anti-sigma regulatory factor (Ser/Thr protein kinase)